MLADIVLSFYLGGSQTRPSDLRVVQTARGNDATIHAVRWHGYPFRFEVYYGVRLTYTPPGHPWTRFALDYTHYKIYAETDNSAIQDGTWHGMPLTQNAPMRERVQSFEMTHGLNMLGISALQQLSGPPGSGIYAGGGPVVYLPHSESRVDGEPYGGRYEYAGSGFQALMGARGCAGNVPLFAEIKRDRGVPHVTIARGTAQTVVETVHELAGLDFRRCSASTR